MISDDDLQGSDVEFVKPPTDLRKKVRVMSPREAAKFDPVKAAEAALERLSVQFDGWRECPAFCVSVIWSMLPERSKDDDDFERVAGRTAEGLQAA